MTQRNPQDAQNALLTLFATLPITLLTLFAPILKRLGASPALLPALRNAAAPVIEETRAQIPELIDELMPLPTVLSHAELAAKTIRDDLEGKLNLLTLQVARFAGDVYRAVTADAALDQVLGLTPAQAQHKAYERLLNEGVSGFTDSRGRNWELSAYVEMAVRTAAQRAYNAARLEELTNAGFNYFIVSDDGAPCPLCEPWQGVVLTDATPDQYATATIGDATAAGLFHPRCRHVLSGWEPGWPKSEPHPWGPDDQARYAQSQQQRALERGIRAAKRALAGAYTPEMQADARKAVRDAQARMRAFIAETGRVRRPRREQLHL